MVPFAASDPAAPRPAPTMRATAPSTKLLASAHHWLALAVTLVGLLAPSLVHAQTTTPSTPIQLVGQYPQRKHGDTNSTRIARSDDDYVGNAGINRADCDSDELWWFSFTLPPPGFTYLEIWSKSDNTTCADPQYRPGGSNPTCHLVAKFGWAKVANSGVVKVKSSDIVKAAYRLVNFDDPQYPTAKDVCYPLDPASAQPAKVYLHFLLTDSNGLVVGDSAANQYEAVYQTTYDLIGPDPPQDLTLGVGETIVVGKWTTFSSTEKDFVSFKAYCFPKRGSQKDPNGGIDAGYFSEVAPSTETGTDTGTDAADDASDAADTALADETSTTTDTGTGTDGETSTAALPTGCPSPFPTDLLKPRTLPNVDLEELKCGELGANGGTLQIDGLVNDQPYAVAIAAVDKYGNSGVLSNVACGTPVQTTDFFDAYRNDGGQAGGGFCTFGAPGSGRTFAALAGLVAALLFARRHAQRPGARR